MDRGFTLIETMVAIAIISVTMVAPFEAVEYSITASDTSRDELIGSMLAQEAIEEVRQIRDDDYLISYNTGSTPTWLYGLDGSTFGGMASPNCFANKCTIDSTPLTTTPVAICNSGICPVLYLSDASSANPNFYNQTKVGSPTAFTRSIQLTTVSATEVKITSITTWTTNHIPYNTTIYEYLDNWQP
jgi:prepilin-type N-terminal cleavage/methylation domain-containing protein